MRKIALSEMLKGVLDGVVLQLIGDGGGLYGYQIIKRLGGMGFGDMLEGTMYALLARLEKNGWVTKQKAPSHCGPARNVYELTDSGRQQLADFWIRWDFISRHLESLRKG